MKRILFLVMLPLLLFSCGTQKTLTPNELKMMTTRQIEANYSLAFSSVISLLQSEGFLVTNTDRESGIINANVDHFNANIDNVYEFLYCSGSKFRASMRTFNPLFLCIVPTNIKLTLLDNFIVVFLYSSFTKL